MDLAHQPEMQQKTYNHVNRENFFFKINFVDRVFEDKFPQAAHEKPTIKSKFNAITPVLGDYQGE